MIPRNLRFTILHRFCFPEANAKVATPENGNQSNVLTLSKQKLLKKSMLLLVAFFIFTSVNLMAQSPQKINFQSIVRNTNGVIFSNKTLSFKISILSGSITGTQVYSETHSSTTDAIGLVSLQIGSGTALSGSFATINWGNTAHFIKLEADFNGGNTYVTLGTQELMSVPYAMYASKTDTTSLNLTNRFADKASVNNPTFTGTVGGITKAMVGLSDVDNTTDLNKPVSTLTQTALALKAPLANPTFTGTVYGIDKGMVGLGSVDNTTDASKPVSTATQTALNTKAPINNPEFTGQVYGIDKGMVGLGNVDNTSDVSKPVSGATQTALVLKAPLANPTFTGTVSGIDKSMVGLGNVDNTSDESKPISSLTQTAINTKVNISDTMSMLANYKAALDTKFNKADFPSGSSANEILYWNGLNWVSLPPGTTGQVLTMSSDGLSWGCLITNTAGTPSPSSSLVVNTALTAPIRIATTGATGIDTIASGLPPGVRAEWSANEITIFGTPTAAGTFEYKIILTGGCGTADARGTITVTPPPPSACPTTSITYNGYDYKTVGIGTQCWMAENLRTDEYNDGSTVIPDETANTSRWGDLATGARTEYVVSGVTDYVGTYGYLYNWYAVNDSRKLCPTGWHVPTDSDWNKLVKFIHSGADTTGTLTQSTEAGTLMKKNDAALWIPDEGTNTSGFSGLPGGLRIYDNFSNISSGSFFWSATQYAPNFAWNRSLSASSGNVNRLDSAVTNKSVGASVRCLRD